MAVWDRAGQRAADARRMSRLQHTPKCRNMPRKSYSDLSNVQDKKK